MQSSHTLFSLWLILFTIFLDWVGIGLVYPIFSSMLFNPESNIFDPALSMTTRGIYLGLLLGVMPLAQFFSSPVTGTYSDQKGRKPVFLISLSLFVFGYALSALAIFLKSLSLLIGSRVIEGIAASSSAAVSAAISDLSTSETKSKNFGLMSMACGLGFTCGPFLGGIFSKFGFEMPFLLAGGASLVNLFLIFLFFKETHLVRKKAPFYLTQGMNQLWKAFKIPALRVIFITVFFICFGWSFFYEFIPLRWISLYHFRPEKIGLLYAYGAGFYAISAGILIRPILKRYRDHAILFYALLALGTLLVLLLFPAPSSVVWIYLPLVNFLIALLFPTSNAIVSNWAGADAQGELLGILQAIQTAAFALSPLLAGLFIGMNPLLSVSVGGVCMLIAALILFVCLKDKIFKTP